MNGLDHFRPREHEHVVVAAQLVAVFCETFAAKVSLAELVALDHGAHRPVDDQNALVECGAKVGDAFVTGHGLSFVDAGSVDVRSGLRAYALMTAKCGGRFSYDVISQRSTRRPARRESMSRRSSARKPRLM